MHEEQPDYSNRPDRRNHIDQSGNTRRTNAGKKKKTAGRRALSVLCVILFAMLAIMIAGTAWWENLLNKRHQLNPSRPTLSEEEYSQLYAPDPTDPSEITDPDEPTPPDIDPSEITWNTDPKDPLGGEHIVNIMLIGQDAREGQSVQRSDSMILCTLNRDTNTLT